MSKLDLGLPLLIWGVLIGVSLPLVMRKVPPNDLYGFRTAKTMSSTQIWYEANQRAGVNMIVGTVLAMALWAGIAWRFGAPKASMVFPALLLVMVLGSTAVSLLQLRKM